MTWQSSLFLLARLGIPVVALLSCLDLTAQPLLPYDGPPLPLIVVSTDRLEGAQNITATLINEGEQAIHAYVFTAEHRSQKSGRIVGQFVDTFDTHYYLGHDPIQPRTERQIRFGAGPPPPDAGTTFGVQAVVLADGTGLGSPYWLESVSKRRAAALASIAQVIRELRIAALAGSRQDILAEMTANHTRQQSLDSGRSSVEKSASNLPYELVIGNLRDMPSDQTDLGSSLEVGSRIESILFLLDNQRQRIASARPLRIQTP